jgi:hypothetical protein
MTNLTPVHGDTIVVWFSCGAASAVAAQRTIEKYGSFCNVRIVNNPVKEEDDDNRRFLLDVERWLGIDIEIATNPSFPECSAEEVWGRAKFMSSPFGAPCTKELKKKARQVWEQNNHADWHVLGFTSEEQDRYDRFALTERNNVLPVLIDDTITKQTCVYMLEEAGIMLPRIYQLGYPNANCIGCVKATSATYWNHVRKVHPNIFDRRSSQSREIGAKLVRWKGERMFLDELPEDAKGNSMKNLTFECGIFCEEK